MQTFINNELKANIEVPFNRDKTIKKIMKIESEVFMPKHVPKGTPEDPDNPDFREFTQEEKDACSCPNCKYPFEYFNKKDNAELKRTLASMEEVKRNPC